MITEKPTQDAIDQAVDVLKRFSGGVRLSQVGSRESDAAILLASVGIAIAEQLRRIADTQENEIAAQDAPKPKPAKPVEVRHE